MLSWESSPSSNAKLTQIQQMDTCMPVLWCKPHLGGHSKGHQEANDCSRSSQVGCLRHVANTKKGISTSLFNLYLCCCHTQQLAVLDTFKEPGSQGVDWGAQFSESQVLSSKKKRRGMTSSTLMLQKNWSTPIVEAYAPEYPRYLSALLGSTCCYNFFNNLECLFSWVFIYLFSGWHSWHESFSPSQLCPQNQSDDDLFNRLAPEVVKDLVTLKCNLHLLREQSSVWILSHNSFCLPYFIIKLTCKVIFICCYLGKNVTPKNTWCPKKITIRKIILTKIECWWVRFADEHDLGGLDPVYPLCKQLKNIFQTRGAGYWRFSLCTVVPAAFD